VTAAEAQALAVIQAHVRARQVIYTGHAIARMVERNVYDRDVERALLGALACASQANGRWRVRGQDVDGDDLDVVVAIWNGAIIVTVY
jgi:hypothetical protein